MKAAAQQDRDEKSLLQSLSKTYVIKSMRPDGDCGYEMMCRWKVIHAARKCGNRVIHQMLDGPVPVEDIKAMRRAIADEQDRQVADKGNGTLQTLISQSMFDWWHSPSENNGRNSEVAAGIRGRPTGMDENAWLNSSQALALHSSLIRTGRNDVFAESPEMEAFSLMTGSSLAIYLPGHCEFYPQSKYCKSNIEILVGICLGNHYYLAVPKEWFVGQTEYTTGKVVSFYWQDVQTMYDKATHKCASNNNNNDRTKNRGKFRRFRYLL